VTISWTVDRTALVELLCEIHSDLGELYRAGIQALSQESLSHPRLMIAGHCLRELFNRLPRALGHTLADRSDVGRLAFELFNAWTDGSLILTAVDDPDDDTPRAVSAAVYRAARAVASAAAIGNQNSRELTAIVATGEVGNLDDAAIRRLHQAIEFFRKWTHARDYSKPERTLPSGEMVEIELRILEEGLLTRLGNRADRARAVRELLAVANRRSAGGDK
jgi:hypothetical protein